MIKRLSATRALAMATGILWRSGCATLARHPTGAGAVCRWRCCGANILLIFRTNHSRPAGAERRTSVTFICDCLRLACPYDWKTGWRTLTVSLPTHAKESSGGIGGDGIWQTVVTAFCENRTNSDFCRRCDWPPGPHELTPSSRKVTPPGWQYGRPGRPCNVRQPSAGSVSQSRILRMAHFDRMFCGESDLHFDT